MRATELLGEEIGGLPTQLYAPHPKSQEYPREVKEGFTLKPEAKIWTSTARAMRGGFTSAWVEWCTYNMPGWVGKHGYLFDVSSSAKVLTLTSDKDALRVARKYGSDAKNAADLFHSMPWKSIAADFDAVRYVPREHDFFMGAWDVESTAWFDTSGLQNRRAVNIVKPRDNPVDEMLETIAQRKKTTPDKIHSAFLKKHGIAPKDWFAKKLDETGLWYRGYPCTKDCSGHQAGYAWAWARNAKTYADCGNPWSNSFWEGCKSRIEGK